MAVSATNANADNVIPKDTTKLIHKKHSPTITVKLHLPNFYADNLTVEDNN